MTTNQPLSTRLLSILRPGQQATGRPHRGDCNCRTCAPRPAMDDADFAEFVLRTVRAWEARVIENPAMLPTHQVIEKRVAEITNVAIACNAERYAIDPRTGVSMLECQRILGISSKATISGRRARGVAIMGERIDRAGAARFAEAQRERQLVSDAQDDAADELQAYRERRAS